MLESEEPIGVVQLLNKKDGPFTEQDAAVMDTVAAVSTMAYFNYRLSEESSRASTLLGMGKVGHDIGNLAASLYANVSFSEFAVQNLKHSLEATPAPEALEVVSQLEPSLMDIKSSVDRIVGYSRLMSEMSAGRELQPSRNLGSLSETIRSAATYLEPIGRANNIRVTYEIDDGAPLFPHDQLYMFRIVQNLAGNAVKAVLETVSDESNSCGDGEEPNGEVIVRYRWASGSHILEVHDTGPGMSKATIEKILNGTIRSKWDKGSGSGWGTKIVLELAATHGGLVDIDSHVGHGSTFRVCFPHVQPSELVEAEV